MPVSADRAHRRRPWHICITVSVAYDTKHAAQAVWVGGWLVGRVDGVDSVGNEEEELEDDEEVVACRDKIRSKLWDGPDKKQHGKGKRR